MSENVVADCLFCKIVAGQIPATVVAESDAAFAFRDLQPQAPTHILVVPKRHAPNLAMLVETAPHDVAPLFDLVADVAQAEGIAESGYRIVANTGPDAQQTVFHTHIHLLGGRAFGWPPG